MRLIDAEGQQLGVLKSFEALRLAREKGLDLILISPNAQPPVAKIGDYGKFKYEMAKHDKEAKKSQRASVLKEIKLTPKIGEHDLQVRITRVKEFLEKKNKIKVNMYFRGREMTHRKFGEKVLARFLEAISDLGVPEAPAKLEGRNLVLLIVPK